MTELTKPDLTQRGLDRLPSYWDDKPLATGLLKSLLQAFQNPLDLIFEILNETSLEDAKGVQLDIIGRLWATSRGILSDDDYRLAISQAITNSTVDSTPERIYEIMKVASNATQLELTEYKPNIYLYLNVAILDTLKELALTTKAAGVNIKLAHPPIVDGKSGKVDEAWDYSNAILMEDATATNPEPEWTLAFGGTIANVSETLTTSNKGLKLSDTTTTSTSTATIQAGIAASNPKDTLSISFFLEKGATSIMRMYVIIFDPEEVTDVEYKYRVDSNTGASYEESSVGLESVSLSVRDVGDYFFVKLDMHPLFDLLTDGSETNFYTVIYPSFTSTVSGSVDATLVSSNTIVQFNYKIEENTAAYSHIVSTSTGLRCSTLLLDEYFLVDNVGDFIIDNLSDFITVESGLLYLNGAEPLGIPANIKHSQPCTIIR